MQVDDNLLKMKRSADICCYCWSFIHSPGIFRDSSHWYVQTVPPLRLPPHSGSAVPWDGWCWRSADAPVDTAKKLTTTVCISKPLDMLSIIGILCIWVCFHRIKVSLIWSFLVFYLVAAFFSQKSFRKNLVMKHGGVSVGWWSWSCSCQVGTSFISLVALLYLVLILS